MEPLGLSFRCISRRSAVIAAICLVALLAVSARADLPKVGEPAPNFRLRTLDDQSVELARLTAQRPVLLVVLRGWPGYQCPICALQVHEFVSHVTEFTTRHVQVLMVYPGPAEQLKAHAQEFLHDKQWPADFLFVIDPDYAFTNVYGLRWSAPKETAYPSTLIIDQKGRIRFAHVSNSHGDRISASEALTAIDKLLP